MRIALIHAVTVAMAPVEAAFQRHWPDAERMNLLDDRLSVDRAADGQLTPAMQIRIMDLARYAHAQRAQAILFTCSAFGSAIEATASALPVPVLKPNEAMFAAALSGTGPVGLLASFAPSVPSMEAEFHAMAGTQTTLHTACASEAMAALQAGDGDRHDRLLAQAASTLAPCAAIMLAQFSTARAADAVEQATGVPVLTSPDSAVLALRTRLGAA